MNAQSLRRKDWGQRPLDVPTPLDVDAVVAAMKQAGAEIVPLSEKTARQALRDQVLLRGPASRKSGVKTGAADSAWIRSVVEHNGGDADGLVLVTGDKRAVSECCAQLGIAEPRRVAHLGEIGHLLGEATSATGEQLEVFQLTVIDALGSSGSSGRNLEHLADLDRHHWWSIELDFDTSEWERQESFVTLRSTTVVNAEFDAWSNSLTGPLRVLVDVEDQYARQDQWGDQPEFRGVFYEAWVEGEATVFFGELGNSAEMDGLFNVQLGVDPESLHVVAI